MKSFLSSLVCVGLAAAGLVACSGSSGTHPDAGADAGHDSGHPVEAGPPVCDEAKCYPGNKCLADAKGVVSCQLPCAAQPGQTPPPGGPGACPFNYTCTDFPAGTGATAERAFCTPDKTAYKNGPGVWGARCEPSGGIETNPACDSKQGFWCNATYPGDGAAYCTIFQCATDADCRGGWWCATQNVEPNAMSNGRLTTGQTITVCKPRDYCSTCQSDLDCDSTTGIPEHCIIDKNGGKYCSPECKDNTNCATDAQCYTVDQTKPCSAGGGMACACQARAHECTGDGKLCAPCLSDADCKAGGGLCLQADYSTEHFCSVPSKIPCVVVTEADGGQALQAQCPTTDEAPSSPNIGCLTQQDHYNPPNQCIGIYTVGIGSGQPAGIPGCWSPNR